MKDSVLVEDQERCVICGKPAVQRHHVFFGSNRKNAHEDGYWIPLCLKHHIGESKEAIHFNHDLDLYWKQQAQKHFEKTHTREQFRRRYGKSYL